MSPKFKHKSFYGFFPSEMFDFGIAREEIQRLEENNRELSELIKLKTLYKEHMPPTYSHEDIIEKCEYAKRILKLSTDDIAVFSENSQRTAAELVSLMSLFVSVVAVGLSVFGEEKFSLLFVIFGIIAIIGTCCMYIKSVNLRTSNSALMEMYRKMLMCFETVEEMADERKKAPEHNRE